MKNNEKIATVFRVISSRINHLFLKSGSWSLCYWSFVMVQNRFYKRIIVLTISILKKKNIKTLAYFLKMFWGCVSISKSSYEMHTTYITWYKVTIYPWHNSVDLKMHSDYTTISLIHRTLLLLICYRVCNCRQAFKIRNIKL